MQEVEPKVSTDSKFLTRTDFLERFLAVIAREIGIQPNSPSGTFAMRMPIPKTTQVRIGYPIAKKASKKTITLRTTATIEIITMNRSISVLKGVFLFFSPEERSAIYPRIVLSPVAMTTPVPWPCLQRVPKNKVRCLKIIIRMCALNNSKKRLTLPCQRRIIDLHLL